MRERQKFLAKVNILTPLHIQISGFHGGNIGTLAGRSDSQLAMVILQIKCEYPSDGYLEHHRYISR